MSPDLETLADLGCLFVKLARNEKRPVGAAWPERATGDMEAVSAWYARGHNIGILLGPASGVVDVEFDTPAGHEQLAAFGVLDIPTPTWRSTRGEHRLFRWEPWMPPAAFIKSGDLEIRIGGRAAQSVLPPSRHPSGCQYTWAVRPTDCPIAPFPAQLLAGVPCGV